ncbi:MAG: hypothetical protein E7254_10650 [Lachnospiraceae bacterium]|nr:hypothetical protein [Lachnospiraceae bacterium]
MDRKKVKDIWFFILTVFIAFMILTTSFIVVRLLSSREISSKLYLTEEVNNVSYSDNDNKISVTTANFWEIFDWRDKDKTKVDNDLLNYINLTIGSLGYDYSVANSFCQISENEYINTFEMGDSEIKVYINKDRKIYSVIVDKGNELDIESEKEKAKEDLFKQFTSLKGSKKFYDIVNETETHLVSFNIVKKAPLISHNISYGFHKIARMETLYDVGYYNGNNSLGVFVAETIELKKHVGIIVKSEDNKGAVFMYYDYKDKKVNGITVYCPE